MSLHCHPTQAIQLAMLEKRGLESLENPRDFSGSIVRVPGGEWGVH
jgi:hypothetical protein